MAFWQIAYTYDSIETPSNNVKVIQSGYYIANKNISANEAYALYKSNAFKELPQKARSFGFDDKSYWYAFVVSAHNNSLEQYYLDIKSHTVDRCEFYAIKYGALIKSEKGGSLIPSREWPTKESPTRFALINTDDTVTYLLKINTNSPRFSAFAFGTQSDVSETWRIQSFIFAFTTGIFMFVTLFSLVLFVKLKDKIYLFYMLYICGLYGSVVITSEYTYMIPKLFPGIGGFLVMLTLQAQFVGLTLFTEHLLGARSKMPRLAHSIRVLLYVNIAILLVFPIHPFFRTLSFIMSTALFISLLFIAVKALKYEFKLALYYLIATGAALALTILFTLTHQGVITYGLVSSNFLTIALIWDMAFLSLAIAYRIRLLQLENMEKERILTLKSRQETLGELTGNVAHQWRSPLAEIGSIVSVVRAKMLYSQISKEEHLDYLARLQKITKHLSDTVETFRCFLVSKDKKEYFDFSKSLLETADMVTPSLATENIKLLCDLEADCEVLGEQNEILQAVLVLIQNAKEALIQTDTQDGYIHINLSKKAGAVVLTIKDNAGGIKLIPIDKVFDPYLSTKQNSTGMGLFLAKTIIEKRHNGTLSVENGLEGAVFTVAIKNRLSIRDGF